MNAEQTIQMLKSAQEGSRNIPPEIRRRINSMAHYQGQQYGTQLRNKYLLAIKSKRLEGASYSDLLKAVSEWESAQSA